MKTYKYTINGVEYEVTMVDVENGQGIVKVNGVQYKVEREGSPMPSDKPKVARPVREAHAPRVRGGLPSAYRRASASLPSPPCTVRH